MAGDHVFIKLEEHTGTLRLSVEPMNAPIGNLVMDYRFSWAEIQECIALSLNDGAIDSTRFQTELRRVAVKGTHLERP